MSDDKPQDPAPEAPPAERALDMAGAGQIILPAQLDHKSRPRPGAVKRPRPAAGPKRK